MGTSISAKQLAGKLHEVSTHSGDTNRGAVFAATFVYKDQVLLAGKGVAGADMRLSRWGAKKRTEGTGVRLRTGRKITAGFDIKGKVKATSILYPRPQGMWKVLEAGAPPHPMVAGISVRRYNTQKRKLAERGYGLTSNKLLAARSGGQRQKALALASGQFRAAVNHPGVQGRSTWSRALKIARPRAKDVYAAHVFNAHVKVFR